MHVRDDDVVEHGGWKAWTHVAATRRPQGTTGQRLQGELNKALVSNTGSGSDSDPNIREADGRRNSLSAELAGFMATAITTGPHSMAKSPCQLTGSVRPLNSKRAKHDSQVL
ncbi:hypothetical protein SORBI_3003G042150 [Sorghum bicolor]|uniref:Uncharacterized protein n=1 Tax=Sorghum bicolor TaxID=4558 RepID=A0A1W0VVS4_SORBI|nr:hypothetical protein SORBI_3003G042150 [Sorghum bicolor]